MKERSNSSLNPDTEHKAAASRRGLRPVSSALNVKATVMNKRGLIAAAFLSGFFALMFVIFGGFTLGFSTVNLLFLGGAGAILGMIGAPELEPGAFRYPTLWQMLFAVFGCTLLAVVLDAPPEGYVFAVVIGVVLGYLAPYWIKHIQAP